MITERLNKQQKSKKKINLRTSFIRKLKKLQQSYKFILVMSPQPVNQNEKKVKAIDRIRKLMKEDMQEKPKCRTIQNDKWERKQYIKKYESNESDTTCPFFRTEEDTTENIMVCQEGNDTYNLLDENEMDWEKIFAIYKNNEENRKKLKQ